MSQDPNSPTHTENLDLSQFGTLLRAHRGSLSLRQAAAEAGVSFSTLGRAEAGAQPDLTSFTLLCAWLGIPPSQFFSPMAEKEVAPIDEAIAHLSADPRLVGGAAEKIVEVLRGMYDNLANAPADRPVLACHLRAAGILRPGVPQRLSSLLTKMHAELETRYATQQP